MKPPSQRWCSFEFGPRAGIEPLGHPVIQHHIHRCRQVHAAFGGDVDGFFAPGPDIGAQAAVFGAEDVEGAVGMGVLGQGAGAFDQFHGHRRAAQGDDALQIVDTDQRDVVVHAFGVGDEVAGALITLAGVEHRIDAVATCCAHHRTYVLCRLGIEQADAAVPFVCHVPGSFAKKARLYGLAGGSGGDSTISLS